MNPALAAISNDWHIESKNTEQIIGLIKQKIKLAKKLETTTLICLGDVFQSRQAQPLNVLKCFEKILDLIDEAGMVLYCIAGNHDKTDYSSEDSFLDQFQWHPSLKLFNVISGDIVLGGGIHLQFIPFFEESKYIDILDSLIKDNAIHSSNPRRILCSHQALSGSVNNDGSKIENNIKPSLFENFFKVFLGHYHNQSQIGRNIFHLPSLQANNFGEDNEKGFTVLYADGSHELVNSIFPEYHTIKIDLDKVNKEELNQLKKDGSQLIKESDANIRFKIEGSSDKVGAIKSEEFTALGIDVKKEHKTIIKSIEKAKIGEVIIYDNTTILDKFDKFCETEEYDNIEYGKSCLTKKLKE